jgi:hypothetical protein
MNPSSIKSKPEGWNSPQPEKIPRPTYVPAFFALSCIFVLFGVVTSWQMSAVGAILFIISLIGWIGELRHEQRQNR